MDHEDFWKLAKDATFLFSNVATSTAVAIMQEKRDRKSVETSKRLGILGAKLCMIHTTLNKTTPEEKSFMSKRIPKLLALLERLCTGKSRSNSSKDPLLRYPNLRGISSTKIDQHDLVVALTEFATYKEEIVGKCFSSLDKFGMKREDHKAINHLKASVGGQALAVADPAGGDQSHIIQALYEALCCPCTCSSTTRQGLVCSHHLTRLQLYNSVANSQDKAIFDVVFSSIPVSYPGVNVQWQQLRFEIPKKPSVGGKQKDESHPSTLSGLQAPYTSIPLTQEDGDDDFLPPPTKKKGARFIGSVSRSSTNQPASFAEQYDSLQAEDFCGLLSSSFGNIRIRLRVEGGVLHQIPDPAISDQNICSSPSMPLATMLGTQSVSSKDRVVLAYILARATWQYYSSDFMKVCWTSDSVHFMPEKSLALDIDDDSDRTKLDPSKPYFAFQFNGSDDPAAMEYCHVPHVLHRYPRILALATILMELGYPRGGLPPNPTSNLQEQINNDWNKVQKSLDNKKWPRFGFQNTRVVDTYRAVVSKCLDHRAFEISSSADFQSETAQIEQRRAILYNNVVNPLYQLLSDSGSLKEEPEPGSPGNFRSRKAEENLQVTFPGSSVQPRPSCTEYTVGWICAVQVEKVAACELLDEEYAPPAFSSAHDNNIYEFGRISQHKVVIAALPKGKYGTTSAAAVAGDMRRSFPLIKFGLMVGIAGGAPSMKHDIRLGDVVVSCPDGRSSGVVHYDFGKSIQSKEFQRTGSYNGPPTFLLNAVQSLSAQHERKGHQIEQTAALMVEKNPRLKRKYQRPGPETDRLYQTAYLHEDDGKSCKEACDQGKTMLQTRPHRDETNKTVIHHGLIASADKLMKDAQVRDTLAEKEGILCFEMEAAGLMDHFPCLVIRGICDYSDTHKNDAWQGYAAVAAAAYAKELLGIIPFAEVETSQDSAKARCV